MFQGLLCLLKQGHDICILGDGIVHSPENSHTDTHQFVAKVQRDDGHVVRERSCVSDDPFPHQLLEARLLYQGATRGKQPSGGLPSVAQKARKLQCLFTMARRPWDKVALSDRETEVWLRAWRW